MKTIFRTGTLSLVLAISTIQVVPAQSLLDKQRQAVNEALRLSDPRKKVEALEKAIADFSDGNRRLTAETRIKVLSTLLESMPAEKDRILFHAQKLLEVWPQTNWNWMGENEEAVSSLMKAAVPLDSVETLFRQGIESSSKDSDRDLLIAQLTYQAALGRIRLQQGETRDAEEAFLAVRSRTPYNPRVYNGPLRQSLQGLASLAGKTGDNDKVLDFLIEQSFLQEKSTEFWDRLKATYRTTHQNSLDGLTETLDARYQKLLPNPVHPQPYRPTPARSDRTVLAEVFTGTWCPPCAATTLAFDAFLERYSRTDLILLVYHVWNDDPMQNPSSLSRLDYYKVNGIPDILVDGVSTGLDGDSRDKTPEVYGRIQPFIERQLETEAHGEINLNATRVNSTIEVKVTPKASGNRANLRLHIVLVEEMLRYSGRNYTRFHPMVVRNVAGEGARGIPMKESGETVSWRFDLSAIVQQNEKALNENERRLIHSIDKSLLEINSNNLTVVAFLQDETTKQVLQAVSQRVKP